MQKNAFIIAEYNPFHNGHLYHIGQTKKAGAETVTVIMSGNYVQRGECALIPKYDRAKAAILAGADLVLELPLKYGISGTEYFAKGALLTAVKSGLGGTLSFGAEGDMSVLCNCVSLLSEKSTQSKIAELCRCKGYSFPRSQQAVVSELLGEEYGKALSLPNNILAVRYMIENMRLGSPFDYLAVKREGAEHDGETASGTFMSAMQIRTQIENGSSVKGFVPPYSDEIIRRCIDDGRILSKQKFNIAAVSRLQALTENDFAETNCVNQGLERLFTTSSRYAVTLDEICSNVKSKRYTLSRLRQICLGAVLGIKRSDIDLGIGFVNVLGFNEKGSALLRRISDYSEIPFTGLLSQAYSFGVNAKNDVELLCKADSLYNLCLVKPIDNYYPYNSKPFILKTT